MEEVVKQFIMAYYNCVMNNRSQAYTMYAQNSFMSYNGENVQGAANIQKKFDSFSFKTIKVNISIYFYTLSLNF